MTEERTFVTSDNDVTVLPVGTLRRNYYVQPLKRRLVRPKSELRGA